MSVLVVILLGYSSHFIYGAKLGIMRDHVQASPAMNATTKLDRNDTDKFLCNDLIRSASGKNISDDNNENVNVGIEKIIRNDCKSSGILGLNDNSLTRSPGNEAQSSEIWCSPPRKNKNDSLIWASSADNGNSTDTLKDDLIQSRNIVRFAAIDNDNSTSIENDENNQSGHIERLTISDGNSTDIDDAETDQSGYTGRPAIDENNSTHVTNGDIHESGTPTPPTLHSADTDQSVPPSQSEEVTVKGDCAASATQPQNDEPEPDNTKILPPSNYPQGKDSCVFVSQNYIDFYRIFVLFDSMFLYFIPVALLIGCNTATWIKVYRISHGPLINTTSQMLQRTRHVIILTSLISITFILFITPLSISFALETKLDENIQYALYNDENRAVFNFIAECFYLCNPTCNFFLYIISGKRFRNSLKSVFCKPSPK